MNPGTELSHFVTAFANLTDLTDSRTYQLLYMHIHINVTHAVPEISIKILKQTCRTHYSSVQGHMQGLSLPQNNS